MKLLSEIIKNCKMDAIIGTDNRPVSAITLSSKGVEKDTLFIAQKGTSADGHLYIEEAIAKGATTIVCQKLPKTYNVDITYIQTQDTQEFTAIISDNFYNHPQESLTIIGITGTNGKTTTAHLTYETLISLGFKVGLISTINIKIGTEILPATHTTPDAISLHKLFRQMADAGCTHVVMEVSSHALVQKRVFNINYKIASFTNITHDHLDYHQTFDAYIQAKKILFDNLSKDAIAITNADEKHSDIMTQNTRAKIVKYGISNPATYKAKIVEQTKEGTQIIINHIECWLGLIGYYNIYNALTCYAICSELGFSAEDILKALSLNQGIEGRLEVVRSKTGKTAIVDYAHTPDAVKNVLNTLNKIKSKDTQLICVLGCGGNRDKSKRPIMGKAGLVLSDKVIFTSDNPRYENAESIIEDMKSGLKLTEKSKVLSITDRAEAIKTASMLAQEDDIVVVLGKGHENYQEINGVKKPFSDKQILTDILNQD